MRNGVGHIRIIRDHAFSQNIGIVNIFLCALGNLHHGADSLDGILTRSGLAGQHNGTGAVVNGIGHVSGLCSGRTGIADHGIQHLGCRNDLLARVVYFMNDHLLDDRHILQRYLHAHVASGYHDAVRYPDDLVNIFHALHILNLGNDIDGIAAFLLEDPADLQYILCITHEGCGDKIKALFDTKADIAVVLFTDERHGKLCPRHIHTLVVGHRALVEHPAYNVCIGNAQHRQLHQSVIDQYPAARLDIMHQFFIGNGNFCFVSLDLICSQCKRLALFQQHLLVILEVPQTNLRPLGIQHGCHRQIQFFPDFLYNFQPAQLFLMVAVGEIKTGNVHALQHQLADHLLALTCRSQCTYDFCFSHS